MLLHPCSGRLPPSLEQADAARYTALGYVVLAVDSFGARGIADGCAGGGASVDVVMDAYGALMHLASLPFIDPDRIALVGYSYGGGVALSAVVFDGPERLFERQFAAAVAYHPWCPDKLAVSVPTLILIGEQDEWAPARACRAMMARRTGLGASLRLVVYPEAHHAFNLPLAPRRTTAISSNTTRPPTMRRGAKPTLSCTRRSAVETPRGSSAGSFASLRTTRRWALSPAAP